MTIRIFYTYSMIKKNNYKSFEQNVIFNACLIKILANDEVITLLLLLLLNS